MIEPQNTMMPLAAEPRAADAPTGDPGAFGEMLAQSLGAIIQVDTAAVQQVMDGNGQQPSDGDLSDALGDLLTDQTESDSDDAAVRTPVRLRGALTSREVTAPFVAADPVVGGISDPVPAGSEILVADQDLVRALPTEPVPTISPDVIDPADGIWQPVLTDDPLDSVPPPTGSDVAVPAPHTPDPVDSIGVPILTADPDTDALPDETPAVSPDLPPAVGGGPRHDVPLEAAPATPVTPGIPPQPAPNGGSSDLVGGNPPLPTDPIQVDPAPVRPTIDRDIPVTPAPMSSRDSSDMPAVSPPTTPIAAPIAGPALPTEPVVTLLPDAPVQLNGPRRVVATPTAALATEVAAPIAADSGNMEGPVVAAPQSAVDSPPASFTQGVSNALTAQASALAERVMQAIDLQRTQPPPRSMVVDIPEIEGLRLVVSVGTSGQVHVGSANGSTSLEALSPFMDDLGRVLAERGFSMSGDAQRRGRNPNPTEEDIPFRLRRPTFQRASRTDTDLRI